MKKILVLLVISLSLFNSSARAQTTISRPKGGNTGTWRLLGTTHAYFNADHDIIVVQGPYDFFRKLKFKVTDAPLNMVRMFVRYDDGGAPEKIDLRFNIPQGGESRVIELKGTKRKLKSVEFWYDTKGVLNGGADLTLIGMK